MRSGCATNATPIVIRNVSRSLWWKDTRSAKKALHGQTVKWKKSSSSSRSWLGKIMQHKLEGWKKASTFAEGTLIMIDWKIGEYQQSLLKDQLHYFEELQHPHQQELQQPHHQGNRFSKLSQRHGRPASQRSIMPKQSLRIFDYFLLFPTYHLNL